MKKIIFSILLEGFKSNLISKNSARTRCMMNFEFFISRSMVIISKAGGHY